MQNSTDSIIPLTPATSPETALPPVLRRRRRTGKIAQLPRDVRHHLNELIQDGVSYLKIIQELGPHGEGLTEDILSKWKNNGYHEWLEERRLTEVMGARSDFVRDILSEAGDPTEASQAVLQTLSGKLCRMLAELDPAGIRDDLLNDADKFSRFTNAMVRLAQSNIQFEQHQAAKQDRQEEKANANRPAIKGGITEESFRRAEAKLNLM